MKQFDMNKLMEAARQSRAAHLLYKPTQEQIKRNEEIMRNRLAGPQTPLEWKLHYDAQDEIARERAERLERMRELI